MKKTLLSMAVALVTLSLFGLMAFAVLARPVGFAQNTQTAGREVAAAQFVQAPVAFEAEAVAYGVSQVEYDWIDISAGSDEQIKATEFEDNLGSEAIDIGFYFPFFDNVYRQLRLSDNGYIYFGGDETNGSETPQAVPSAVDNIHNLIAPLGADLFRNPDDSAVYIARQNQPERRLVVQFERAYWCCNLEQAADFQIILYPDGRILTQYKSIGDEPGPRNYLTVGLENEDGSQGQPLFTGFLDEADTLAAETAFLYDSGETITGQLRFIPPATTVEAQATQILTFTTDLLNLSGLESAFTLSQKLQINGVEIEGANEGGWQIKTLAEPGLLDHTGFAALTVEVAVPATAVAGDMARVVFTAQADAIEGLEAETILTVVVAE